MNCRRRADAARIKVAENRKRHQIITRRSPTMRGGKLVGQDCAVAKIQQDDADISGNHLTGKMHLEIGGHVRIICADRHGNGKFISTHVHDEALDARVAVEVIGGGDIRIISGIDAR